MNINYGKFYDENYYKTSFGEVSYLESDKWMPFFENIADNIVKSFHPSTVLDVGCAMGYLVAALRDRGVEAYGIDVSEFAISRVREDIKPYCRVWSALDPLPADMPQKYDLLVTIEVAEHLFEEDSAKFIEYICSYSDHIIFSSTSEDITEKTHFNVQQPEYWAKKFARHSFFKDLFTPMAYISKQAALYVKRFDISDVIHNYEMRLRLEQSRFEKQLKHYDTFYCNLFYDIGEGFNNRHVLQSQEFNKGEQVNITMQLTPGTKSLRFDPVEGKCCIVKGLQVVTNHGVVTPININGTKIDEFDIFDTTDPQFVIDLNGINTNWVRIQAFVYPFDEIDIQVLLARFRYFSNIVRDELLRKEAEIRTITSKYMASAEKINDLEKEINKLKYEIETISNQYIILQNTYKEISNSAFWKVTKPCRLFLDTIKKLRIIRILSKVKLSIKHHGFKYTVKKIKSKILGYRSPDITIYKFLEKLSKDEEEYQRNFSFNNRIKISIIVPTYNTKKEYLHDLIESVMRQTYDNWELCIADGGSYAQTVKELKKLCGSDSRIKLKLLSENKGIAGNTNEAYSLSTGDFIVLLDHDDFLSRDALFEIAKSVNETPDVDFIYSDRAVFSDETKKILAFHYFPAFSPEYLRSCNDTSHLTAFSRRILEEVGFEREGYDGSQDYELELRVVEKARRIVNIQKVLYFCRACEGSVALNPESKYYAYEAGRKAISEHIARIGYPGDVEFLKDTFSYRIRYKILEKYKVSIIIPNKDHIEALRKCIDSIFEKTTYDDYEIIIVENNSTLPETFAYYDSLKDHKNVKVLYYPEKEFNFSAINNWAVERANGNIILLLNNDVEVITENWLTEMLMYAQMNEVGAVGAILIYPNNTYQHTGLFIGLGGHIASSFDHGKNITDKGYMRRLVMPQNYSAVTGACLMIKKDDYIRVGGLDEVDFKIGLNDVDFCLKLRELGKRNVVTPYARLYHYESLSRGSDQYGENHKRYQAECEKFRKKWEKYFINGDPYLNKNMING